MPSIIQRPRAIKDLAEVWDYIADDSEARADAFIDLLDRKIRALAQRPNMGRAREELGSGLRSFPVDRYVIAIPKGIEIVRVLHGARDLDAIFHEDH
ncbi:MAG: type II toxin-antitoxin system RelE/ParE family toxin [Syntrophus sp. (in: bacteria)]|nr:type II toxin-antitoxin system RelE/ParE family toxin [Syntrophus sp. (in: bacteria)]MBA4419072.1 type II toxin-antitoxin system RelE/ParE family toxin [Syntrophus sp. (in: bacteria)]